MNGPAPITVTPISSSTPASARPSFGGDVAVWFDELEEPHTEGQRLVGALGPERVSLTYEHEPWRSPIA
ncbi:MAG TPA: hypothetical protein VIT65_08120 [Microlunatus sp.]